MFNLIFWQAAIADPVQQDLFDAQSYAQKRFADEALRNLRATFCVAQEMGARLGKGALLLKALSG